MFNSIDYDLMSMALELASKGAGLNHPNPLVGAVISKNNQVVGCGYHLYENIEHAERIAITKAGLQARGATLYVNLEPCAHHGRALPCTDIIISSGIKRVVFSINDPDYRVNGKGERILAEAGITVEKGLLAERASELNRDYLKTKRSGLPWVLVKVATTLDGKIGIKGMKGERFSSPESLKLVHQLRAWCDAIMVGANTVRIDDPLLTCRIHQFSSVNIPTDDNLIYPLPQTSRNPVRVTISRNLDIPLSSRICDPTEAKTIIFTDCNVDSSRIEMYESKRIIIVPIDMDNHNSLETIMRKLTEFKIMNVMVEGGGELIGSLISERLVDELYVSVSPMIIGNTKSVDWVKTETVENFLNAYRFEINNVFKIGNDFLVRARRKGEY